MFGARQSREVNWWLFNATLTDCWPACSVQGSPNFIIRRIPVRIINSFYIKYCITLKINWLRGNTPPISRPFNACACRSQLWFEIFVLKKKVDTISMHAFISQDFPQQIWWDCTHVCNHGPFDTFRTRWRCERAIVCEVFGHIDRPKKRFCINGGLFCQRSFQLTPK